MEEIKMDYVKAISQHYPGKTEKSQKIRTADLPNKNNKNQRRKC
jgi:hypothetical protein